MSRGQNVTFHRTVPRPDLALDDELEDLERVAAGLAAAQAAAARDDPDAALAALSPVARVAQEALRAEGSGSSRTTQDDRPSWPALPSGGGARGGAPGSGLLVPGVWPWADLYAEALVATGRAAEADVFLRPHEQRAARGPASALARLARARGRVEAARGRPDDAETAFRRGLAALAGLTMPFERALLELAFGEFLHEHGRAAEVAPLLDAAHARFAALGAAPYAQRARRASGGAGDRERTVPGSPPRRPWWPVSWRTAAATRRWRRRSCSSA